MSDASPINGEYAALLRQAGTEQIEASRIYFTALTLIRQLVRLDLLQPVDKVSEIKAVLSGLDRVQEELDSTGS